MQKLVSGMHDANMHPAAWELYITTWSHFSWLKRVISSHSKRFEYGLPPFFWESTSHVHQKKIAESLVFFQTVAFKSPFWCWSVGSVMDSWTKGQSIPKSQAKGLSRWIPRVTFYLSNKSVTPHSSNRTFENKTWYLHIISAAMAKIKKKQSKTNISL